PSACRRAALPPSVPRSLRPLLSLHSFPTRRSSDLSSCPSYAAVPHKNPLIYTNTRHSFSCLLIIHRALTREQRDSLLSKQNLMRDRKSTRLNSSHVSISYAVSCLKKQRPPRGSLLT